jgi:hypothetical protein
MTTSPDFRALCAELLFAIQLYTGQNPVASEMSSVELTEKLMDAMAATAAALATPPPEPPTDEELEEWADAATEVPLKAMNPDIHGWQRCFTKEEFCTSIRAALERWGNV